MAQGKKVKITRYVKAEDIPAPVKLYAFQKGIGRPTDVATEIALSARYGDAVMAAANKLITEPAAKNRLTHKMEVAQATAAFTRTIAGIEAARLGADEELMREYNIKL